MRAVYHGPIPWATSPGGYTGARPDPLRCFRALFSHGDNTPFRQVMVARRLGRADFKLGSWTMVIILIRRFVKPDKETEFLENYRAQQPLNNPAFIGETLTRLVDSSSLPGGLRSFALGEPSSVTY